MSTQILSVYGNTHTYIYTLVLLAPDLYLSLFLSLTRLCFLIEDAHSLIHSLGFGSATAGQGQERQVTSANEKINTVREGDSNSPKVIATKNHLTVATRIKFTLNSRNPLSSN